MTIQLLTDWPYKRASNAGYVTIPAGSIVSVFDAATETGMIAAKVAAASAAAVTWTPPSDAPIYTELLPAEVAATRSLVSGDRNIGLRSGLAQFPRAMLTRSLTGSYAAVASSGLVQSCHIETALEAGFDQVRLLIPNHGNAAVVYKAAVAVASIAGAANSAATIDPTANGGTWVDCTFAAAGSLATAPIYGGNGADGWAVTDWMDLASLDRTDGGTLPVLHARIEKVAGADTQYTLTGALGTLALWETEGDASTAPYGRFWRARIQQTDGVTTKANFTSTTSAAQHIPVVIQYMCRASGYTIYLSGDSRVDGRGATLELNNAAFRAACALSTPTLPVSVCNQAWSGSTGLGNNRHNEVLVGATGTAVPQKSLLETCAPHVVHVLSDFVNDNAAAPLTAAEQAGMKLALSKFRRLVGNAGAVPLVYTAHPTPSRITNGTDDAIRIAASEEAKAAQAAALLPYLDVRALFTSATLSSGKEVWATGLSLEAEASGVHPSEAGYVLEVEPLKAIYRSYCQALPLA